MPTSSQRFQTTWTLRLVVEKRGQKEAEAFVKGLPQDLIRGWQPVIGERALTHFKGA